MYVKDSMSKNLYTTYKDVPVSNALDIMSSYGLHRLPVVDEEKHLLGLITESLIQQTSGSNSTSLSVFELNYLFNKLKVEEIMIRNPIVIGPDALLEEAADMMLENKIGCLPVMEDDKVVGIITYNDIFKAFIDLLGYHSKGTRYVISVVEDKVGVLNDIAICFKKMNISISNLAVYHTERGVEVVVVATGNNSGDCKKALSEAGYKVTSMRRMK